MKIKRPFGATALSIAATTCFVAACKSEAPKGQESLAEQHAALAPLMDAIRPKKQVFKIDAHRDTTVIGEKGTKFAINQGTFVNEDGTVATSVALTLVEVKSVAEMIGAGLHTTSNGRMLQTEGMFFIDAKDGNKQLTMAPGKSISVEVSANRTQSDAKIFYGSYDSTHQINWELPNEQDVEQPYLVSLPKELLDLYAVSEDTEYAFLGDIDAKYNETYITTREFLERKTVLEYIPVWSHGYKANEPWLDEIMLNFYLNNVDKPLSYADSIAADYLLRKYQIDTTKAPPEVNLNNQKANSKKAMIIWAYYQLKQFSKQGAGNPLSMKQLGINEHSTHEELIAKGIDAKEVDIIVRYLQIRSSLVKELTEYKNRNIDVEKTFEIASYTFNINKLGWVNVDYFTNEKSLAKSDFTIAVDSKEPFSYASVSLIIPSMNISLSSISNIDVQYKFTKEYDPYQKLPVGVPATAVIMAYKNGIPYFGSQELRIPATGSIKVKVDPSNTNTIKEAIAKIK